MNQEEMMVALIIAYRKALGQLGVPESEGITVEDGDIVLMMTDPRSLHIQINMTDHTSAVRLIGMQEAERIAQEEWVRQETEKADMKRHEAN